jgi:hypothetical protein
MIYSLRNNIMFQLMRYFLCLHRLYCFVKYDVLYGHKEKICVAFYLITVNPFKNHRKQQAIPEKIVMTRNDKKTGANCFIWFLENEFLFSPIFFYRMIVVDKYIFTKNNSLTSAFVLFCLWAPSSAINPLINIYTCLCCK